MGILIAIMCIIYVRFHAFFSFYTHFFFGAILPRLCIKQNTRVIGAFFGFLINLHCKMMHVKCVYVLQFFLRGMYCLKRVKNIGHLRGC